MMMEKYEYEDSEGVRALLEVGESGEAWLTLGHDRRSIVLTLKPDAARSFAEALDPAHRDIKPENAPPAPDPVAFLRGEVVSVEARAMLAGDVLGEVGGHG